MHQNVLSITQINEYIRTLMDNDAVLAGISVKGEISNYKIYPSGHHYFTLKDENSALKCVMFRNSASRLRFKPENGMQVIAMGKISVYPRDGAYQLYCTAIIVDGIGDLQLAFEQRKAKLAALGLFDPSHKKELPQYPNTIGIITSSAGAAIHDILRIIRARFPLSKAVLLPVRVQGAEAPEEISAAIHYANAHNLADLLIVGRGGGSFEDLWAFNAECVAHAIYNSSIPVISAVGHEPDVTIADYVADVRAATPSNAAELAVPDQNTLRQTLDSITLNLLAVLERQIKTAKTHLRVLSESQSLQSPEQYIIHRKKMLELLNNRVLSAQSQIISKNKHRFIALTSKLDAMSPLNVLTRGYAIVKTEHGDLVRTIHQVNTNDMIAVKLKDGTILASVADVREDS